MQENSPVTDGGLSSDDMLGENIRLLILHRTFNEILEGEDSKNKEEVKE